MPDPVYVTTPIYYVNDRPHIGHCYTTLVADVAARAYRLIAGQSEPHTSDNTAAKSVFLLTGTDEHADKVSRSAIEHGVSPQEWADTNAARFREAFDFMDFSNDDFIRTTEARHVERASAYIKQLMDQGDIALGDYEGWYDAGQEEYVTESAAREHDYKSSVTGRPLEKRTEQNYFFDLPKYAGWLRDAIASDRVRVMPEARKNEILGRIDQGLQKVPVSRRVNPDDPEAVREWGIRMPGDPEHRVYVWIEALCNYLSAIDNEREPATAAEEGGARRKFWPKAGDETGGGEGGARIVQFMAKDILWFHAAIWPAMLHALGEKTPDVVYAHAYYVAEGKKMSKSLGNFIEIDQLRAYAERYSLDAVRWYLATQGPLGANDADFAYSRFVEVYNADLANGIGNATSRVANMIGKYFRGEVPDPGYHNDVRLDIDPQAYPDGTVSSENTWNAASLVYGTSFCDAVRDLDLQLAFFLPGKLVGAVDNYVNATEPFRIAKDLGGSKYSPHSNQEALSIILYQCAEALRIASLFLFPAMPSKMADLWRRWDCSPLNDPDDPDSGFRAPLADLATWAHPEWGLKPGQKIEKGDALFMRADGTEPPPG